RGPGTRPRAPARTTTPRPRLQPVHGDGPGRGQLHRRSATGPVGTGSVLHRIAPAARVVPRGCAVARAAGLSAVVPGARVRAEFRPAATGGPAPAAIDRRTFGCGRAVFSARVAAAGYRDRSVERDARP